MTKRLAATALVLAAVLAFGLGGAYGKAGGSGTPGVTRTSILIGGTIPLSGSAAAFASVARGADAYFKYVNARGGVHGRKIIYRYLDDGYDPGRTVQQTRRLV